MNEHHNPDAEPYIRGTDALGLGGTNRDETKNAYDKARLIRSKNNDTLDLPYANIEKEEEINYNNDTKEESLTLKTVDGGYVYWDETNNCIVDEFDDEGISKRDRNNYLPFLESDSGKLSKDSIESVKAPWWAFALIIVFGICLFGFSAYSFVSSLDGVNAQSAPMPEQEELFDADSSVTYTGPESNEVDWDEEFSKVSDTASGPGAVVLPSADIYSEMIATGQEEGRMVLPESPLSSWYENSAIIGGEEGNSIIASHVNHRDGQELAPFSRLNQTERGTLVGVEDNEGNRYVYEVTDMSLYERVAVPDEYFRTDGDHEIHLVTCSGDIIEDNSVDGGRVFEYNLIVTAELVEELD